MADSNQSQLQSILSELRDTNKETRRHAVMKLGMLGGDSAQNHLILLVDNTYEDPIVRARAALMLGKIGDERAVMSLIRATDAKGHQTPINAVIALGELGDKRAIAPLLLLQKTSKDTLLAEIEKALKKLGYYDDSNQDEPNEMLAEPQ
jgi:HEAT repeat protein